MSTKRRTSRPAPTAGDGRSDARQNGHRSRGRPSKFGRPGHVVALTLPDDTIRALRLVHPDIGWAIVKLLEREAQGRTRRSPEQPDVELVTIGARQSLIVVNRSVFRSLPGVNIIPLTDARAFLALAVGRGMSDLELAVIDRLADGALATRERRALLELRAQLTAWRHDQGLQVHTRAIFVVERVKRAAVAAIGRRLASMRTSGS